MKANIVGVFKDAYDRMLESDNGGLELELTIDSADWHDGSKITFHAAQVIESTLR